MSNSAQIVTRAFRRLQAIDITEQPSAAEMTHGLDVMSEMVNGWGGKGINTATFTIEGTTVADSDRIRDVSPDTLDIMIGHNVAGTGIPANATVTEIITDKSFKMSDDATLSGSEITVTFTFLPGPAKYEGAMVALLAVRLSEDLGLPVSAKLQMDSEEGWRDILAGYLPDRKARFDRNIAVPAGTWDIDSDVFV